MRKLFENIRQQIFKKKTYSTERQRRNREQKTIIEIAKKVVEEENKTKDIDNRLDRKMSAFLNKTKWYSSH